MGIKFKYKGKVYIDEVVNVKVTVNGQVIDAICPATPLSSWAMICGSGNSPLFYPDMTPILASYRKGTGKTTIVSQALWNIAGSNVVEQYFNCQAKGKSKMYYLEQIVGTRMTDCIVYMQ